MVANGVIGSDAADSRPSAVYVIEGRVILEGGAQRGAAVFVPVESRGRGWADGKLLMRRASFFPVLLRGHTAARDPSPQPSPGGRGSHELGSSARRLGDHQRGRWPLQAPNFKIRNPKPESRQAWPQATGGRAPGENSCVMVRPPPTLARLASRGGPTGKRGPKRGRRNWTSEAHLGRDTPRMSWIPECEQAFTWQRGPGRTEGRGRDGGGMLESNGGLPDAFLNRLSSLVYACLNYRNRPILTHFDGFLSRAARISLRSACLFGISRSGLRTAFFGDQRALWVTYPKRLTADGRRCSLSIHSIAGEADPFHSVPEQNTADQEV